MYDELLEFAVGMARETGKIQLAYFRGDELAVRTKSNVYDVVTRADKESEELIAGMIAERYPDHAILGEEGGSRGCAESDWRWAIRWTVRPITVRDCLFSRSRSPCNTRAKRSWA